MLSGFMLYALVQAFHERRPGEADSLIRHIDRGVQYVSIKYKARLGEAVTPPLVGSVGTSSDQAVTEIVTWHFEMVVIRCKGPWRSMCAVEFATLEWADWPDNRYLPRPTGNILPAEAEARSYDQNFVHPITACLTQTCLRPNRHVSTMTAAPGQSRLMSIFGAIIKVIIGTLFTAVIAREPRMAHLLVA